MCEVPPLDRGKFLAIMLSTYIVVQFMLRAAIAVTSIELLDFGALVSTFAIGLEH